MKKNIFLASTLAFCGFVYGQVGINNVTPKSTLDVAAKSTDDTTAEGIIAPRLTGDQIKSKDALYTEEQTGAIVYVTTGVTGVAEGKTINMITPGYYYYDHAALLWIKIGGSGYGDTTNDAWFNNDAVDAKRLEVGTLSDGISLRPAGTDFIIKDNGSVGIGTKNNTSTLDVIGGNSIYNAGINIATSDVNGEAKIGVLKTSNFHNDDPPVIIAGLVNFEEDSLLLIGGGFGSDDSSPTSIGFTTDNDNDPSTPGGTTWLRIVKENVHVGLQANPRSKFSVDGTIGASIGTASGLIGDEQFTIIGSGNLILPDGNYDGRIYNIIFGGSDFVLSTSGTDTILDAGVSLNSLSISAEQPRVTVQRFGNTWVVISK